MDPIALRHVLVLSRDASDVQYLSDPSGLRVARDLSIFCKMRSSAYDVGSDKRDEPLNDIYGPRSLCGW